MNDTIRYRNQGGAEVTWTRTGTNGGTLAYPVGTYECGGCGHSAGGVAVDLADTHALRCRAI